MDSSAILKEIEAAFAGVTRDPHQSLHQAQLTDQGLARRIHGQDWRDAGLRDPEEDWLDVPGESIDECDAALSHFTPESWRFYIPAYICRSIVLFAAPDHESELLERVVFNLTLHKRDDGLNAYLRQRYEMLSFPQATAVRSFLEFVERESLRLLEETNEFLEEYNDVRLALERYWGDQ